MNERIKELAEQCTSIHTDYDFEHGYSDVEYFDKEKFAELIIREMHRKAICSILITDVIMQEKGQVPTSKDYIRIIHRDFEIK